MIYERTLRRGKHRLFLWKDIEADGSVDTKTQSKTEIKDEMGRLEKVCIPDEKLTVLILINFSLSRNMNAATSRNVIGWTNLLSGGWRRSTRYFLCVVHAYQ